MQGQEATAAAKCKEMNVFFVYRFTFLVELPWKIDTNLLVGSVQKQRFRETWRQTSWI